MRLIPIAPLNLKMAWKDVEKYIISVLPYMGGKYSLDEIKRLIETEVLILWVVYNDEKKQAVGCLLTQIIDDTQCRCLSIFLVNCDDFSNTFNVILPMIKEYATGIHCEWIELSNWSDWIVNLPQHGFNCIQTVMRLKNGLV